MNLTSFMTNPDWEGYISKLGCNKVSLLGQIGQIGRNSKFLFLAFNLLSIQSVQAQQCILADTILASPGLFYSTFTHVHSQATRLFSIDQRADIDLDQQFDFINDDPFDFTSHVTKMFINGEEVSTEARQDKLRKRYTTDSDMPRAYTK